MPAEYFPKIIGKKGSVINKIRDDYGVQINLPARGSEDENTITIVGYQDKAEAALSVIMKIVNELVCYYSFVCFLLYKVKRKNKIIMF